MREQINSRGLERRDDINSELQAFFAYKEELLSICPVNSVEKSDMMKDILNRHLRINVPKLLGSIHV